MTLLSTAAFKRAYNVVEVKVAERSDVLIYEKATSGTSSITIGYLSKCL